MNGADLLIRKLADAGVSACFANPGTSEMQLVAALDKEPRIRAVLGLFEGVVTGDLTLVGPAWDRRSKAVRLGTVSRRKGLSTRLFLTVKGASREQVKPVLKEVIPAGLRVDIGEPTSIGGGDLVRIGLTLSVDADSPQANNLCTNAASAGRIVLETGHPDSPELSIPVCVAIAE